MDRGRDQKQRIVLRPAGWLATRDWWRPSPGVRSFGLAVLVEVVGGLLVALLLWALLPRLR